MMIRRCTTLVLFVLYACGAAGCSSASAPLRVMSFNLRYGSANDGENHWDKRHDLVAETIRTFNPDLLGTQECLAFQADFLKEKFPGYGFLGVGRNDGGPTGEMTAIYYRADRFKRVDAGHFWLSETPDVPGSVSWDSSLTRMCSWVHLRDREGSKSELFFFNTHFDHRGAVARLESARLLKKKIKQIAGEHPVILTGDFNADSLTGSNQPYGELVVFDKSFLRDTFRELHPHYDGYEGTFNGFAGTTTGPRIDWILCSGHFSVKEAGIDHTNQDHRYPSDHFPVTAILK